MDEDDARVSLLKKQTTEVKTIAQENIQKVVARGDNLDDLQSRAESLRHSAHSFDVNARRLRKKMCWQSITLWTVLLIVLVIILITLIASLVAVAKGNKK